MFKKFTTAAAVAALAVVMMPAVSQAGGAKRGEARPACALTKMFERTAHRTDRAVRSIFHRDRTARASRSARAHSYKR